MAAAVAASAWRIRFSSAAIRAYWARWARSAASACFSSCFSRAWAARSSLRRWSSFCFWTAVSWRIVLVAARASTTVSWRLCSVSRSLATCAASSRSWSAASSSELIWASMSVNEAPERNVSSRDVRSASYALADALGELRLADAQLDLLGGLGGLDPLDLEVRSASWVTSDW